MKRKYKKNSEKIKRCEKKKKNVKKMWEERVRKRVEEKAIKKST